MNSSTQSLATRGQRALLLYPPGLEFIAAFLGCLYAGVIAIPAYPPRPNRSLSRIQTIVADAGATVGLTVTSASSQIEKRLADTPDLAALLWLATDGLPLERKSGRLRRQEADSLAFLQYTSGSTQQPKGVMVSHGNLLHNLECIKQSFELTSESVSVSWLPHFHDMGLVDGLLEPLNLRFLSSLSPKSLPHQDLL